MVLWIRFIYGIKDNAFSTFFTFANQFLSAGLSCECGVSNRYYLGRLTDPPLATGLIKQPIGLGGGTVYVCLAIDLTGQFYALFNPLTEARGEDAFLYVLIHRYH